MSTRRSTIIVFLLTIVSNILGLARETCIAYLFGASGLTDAYYIASILPDMIAGLISSTFANALIPVLKREKEESPDSAKSLVRVILFYTTVVLVVVMFVSWLLRNDIVHILAPGLLFSAHAVAVRMTNIMLVSIVFTGLSGVLWGIHNAYENYSYPALTGVIFNTLLLASAIVLAPFIHIYGLAIGFTIGVLGRFLVQITPLIRIGIFHGAKKHFYHKRIRDVAIAAPAIFFSIGVGVVNQIVDRILASSLPSGQITLMNYAAKIGILPYSVFGFTIATTLYTRFISARVQEDKTPLINLLQKSSSIVVFLGATVGTVFFAYGSLLTTVVFRHGAFSMSDASVVYQQLQIYGVFSIFYLATPILQHFFYAGSENRLILWTSTGAVFVNVIVSVILVHVWGIKGLLLGNALSYVFSTSTLFIVAVRRLNTPFTTVLSPCFPVLVQWLLFSIGVWAMNKIMGYHGSIWAGVVDACVSLAVGGALLLVSTVLARETIISREMMKMMSKLYFVFKNFKGSHY